MFVFNTGNGQIKSLSPEWIRSSGAAVWPDAEVTTIHHWPPTPHPSRCSPLLSKCFIWKDVLLVLSPTASLRFIVIRLWHLQPANESAGRTNPSFLVLDVRLLDVFLVGLFILFRFTERSYFSYIARLRTFSCREWPDFFLYVGTRKACRIICFETISVVYTWRVCFLYLIIWIGIWAIEVNMLHLILSTNTFVYLRYRQWLSRY